MTPNGQAKLQVMLERQEALRLKLYRDTQGKATIGYGHNLDAKGISKNIASLILTEDTQDAIKDLQMHLPWYVELNEPRQSGLISMAFNLGIVGLLKFHDTLEALQAQNWQAAHDHVLNSLAAIQAHNRYLEIAQIFLTGELS